MKWKAAVRSAIENYAARHKTVQIDRESFLQEELERLINVTGTAGKTPSQTVSRIFQELREEGELFFAQSGRYVLNSKPLEVTKEGVEDDILDNAAKNSRLILSDVAADNIEGRSRLRRGVSALRRATLLNYGNACALCDIDHTNLLVASHVARWADRPEARGQLKNVICFCKFHDGLYEHGYIALSDEFKLLRKPKVRSRAITKWLDICTDQFKIPVVLPASEYLREHRARVGIL